MRARRGCGVSYWRGGSACGYGGYSAEEGFGCLGSGDPGIMSMQLSWVNPLPQLYNSSGPSMPVDCCRFRGRPQETRFAHCRVAGLHNRTRLLTAIPRPISMQKMMITEAPASEFVFRGGWVIELMVNNMITA